MARLNMECTNYGEFKIRKILFFGFILTFLKKFQKFLKDNENITFTAKMNAKIEYAN